MYGKIDGKSSIYSLCKNELGTYIKHSYNSIVTNNGLKPLVNLTTLHLWKNSRITDNGLKPLAGQCPQASFGPVNLITLKLYYNSTITIMV